MRWRERNKAMALIPNYHINKEVLNAQEEATKKLDLIYQEIDNQEILGGNGLHEHLCTFQMLSNDKTLQAKQCREWRATHPIKLSEDYKPECVEDYCDYCPMFNYIALDDEGKIMYVSRTFS